MGSFLLRRAIQTIFVLLLVTIAVFLIMRLLPGDPVYLYLTEDQMRNFSPAEIQEVRHELGLDKPMVIQYFDWMNGLAHGDLGNSLVRKTPVWQEMSTRLPRTLYLGAIAFILSIVIGIPLGIIAAVRRGKWEDTLSTVIANLGITVPTFWLGIVLIYIFAVQLKWLPTSGYTSPTDNFVLSTRQAIMPVFCLAIFAIASAARQTRSSLLEVVQQDYIRTAWAKGLTERKVIFSHALKNSLIPVVTLKGISLRNIVGG